MANSIVFPRAPGSIQYPLALRAAYLPGTPLWDPDFALHQDPQAYEKIERDGEIAGAMNQRLLGVSGRAWSVQPGGEEPADKALAAVVDDLMHEIDGLQSSLYSLARAIFHGTTWARMYGRRELIAAGGLAPQRWWRPTAFRNIDKQRMRYVNTSQDERRRTGRQTALEMHRVTGDGSGRWERVENPEWLIRHAYRDEERGLGYGRGLMNALYYGWRGKTVALEQGYAGLERWAQGMTYVRLDANAFGDQTIATIQQRYFDAIAQAKSRHALVHDKRDEIVTQDGPAQGHEIVTWFVTYCDNSNTRLILAALLPTGGGEDSGSFARAQTESDSSETLFQFDRTCLGETVRRYVIGLILSLNRPILAQLGLLRARPPRFLFVQEKKADPEKSINVIDRALRAQIPLKMSEVYERIGFSQPGPDDEVFEGIEQAQAAGLPFGGVPPGAEPPTEPRDEEEAA